MNNILREMNTELGSEAPEIEFEFLTSQEYFSQLLRVEGLTRKQEPRNDPKFWQGYERRNLSSHDLIDLPRKQKIKNIGHQR